MVLRPDEEANQEEIERDRSFRKNLSGAASAATGFGIGASGALTSRIMPFLSQYIPVDLAMKGLNKVSPKLADFLKKGKAAGLDVEEGLQFIKDKLNPKTQEEPEGAKESLKENRNIIEKYSPELHQFISDQIKMGRSAIEAGALASLEQKGGKGFKNVIDKIVKDHKTPWSAILESVYGSEQAAKSNPQQQQPNPGPGQQALMDILQKINQRLGS